MKLLAKKSLGQHFLNSRHVLDQMISAAGIRAGENVLEIGPGTGVLTSALLEAGATVIAVEKDRRAISLLREKFTTFMGSNRLKIIEADILDDDIPIGFTGMNDTPDTTNCDRNGSEYALVANIPYYITGAILEKFLEHGPRPTKMVMLVQKEVADRIVATKESILSISVKAFGTPRIVARVPRGAFTPIPKVDSAIIEISNISDRRFRDDNVDIPRFFRIVKAGFAHKRKYLMRNLETVVDHGALSRIWEGLGLDRKVRPEDVGVETWIDISKCE